MGGSIFPNTVEARNKGLKPGDPGYKDPNQTVESQALELAGVDPIEQKLASEPENPDEALQAKGAEKLATGNGPIGEEVKAAQQEMDRNVKATSIELKKADDEAKAEAIRTAPQMQEIKTNNGQSIVYDANPANRPKTTQQSFNELKEGLAKAPTKKDALQYLLESEENFNAEQDKIREAINNLDSTNARIVNASPLFALHSDPALAAQAMNAAATNYQRRQEAVVDGLMELQKRQKDFDNLKTRAAIDADRHGGLSDKDYIKYINQANKDFYKRKDVQGAESSIRDSKEMLNFLTKSDFLTRRRDGSMGINPKYVNLIPFKIIRSAQGSGVVTDRDVAAVGITQDWINRFLSASGEALDGTKWTSTDLRQFQDLAALTYKRYVAELKNQYDADTDGQARRLGTEPEAIRLLYDDPEKRNNIKFGDVEKDVTEFRSRQSNISPNTAERVYQNISTPSDVKKKAKSELDQLLDIPYDKLTPEQKKRFNELSN